MKKERTMEDAIQSMNELIEMQQSALETATSLIELKDKRLNVADRLITIYKKENRILKICFYSLVALHIITSIINFL